MVWGEIWNIVQTAMHVKYVSEPLVCQQAVCRSFNLKVMISSLIQGRYSSAWKKALEVGSKDSFWVRSKKETFALARNRTQASYMAGLNSTTEPQLLTCKDFFTISARQPTRRAGEPSVQDKTNMRPVGRGRHLEECWLHWNWFEKVLLKHLTLPTDFTFILGPGDEFDLIVACYRCFSSSWRSAVAW